MATWRERLDAAWAAPVNDIDRITLIDRIAAERAEDDAVALFERAGARDSAGLETEAEGLYRRALERGLDEDRRVQAVIQLASTIRNLGKTAESLALLRAEYERAVPGPMADAVAAFYALALTTAGHERAAVSIALTALAPHLPRYTRSVTGYAAELGTARPDLPTANTGEGA